MSRGTAADRAAIESRRVVRVYSMLASWYDSGFDWALGPGRRAAISRLALAPGEKVLEIGVGTGLSLLDYPEHGSVTGIDISEEMLEQAHLRAEELGRDNVHLRLMDARELAFPDASFDCVVAPYVMSVVPEPERVMAEIRRVCRPGGRVMVVNQFKSSSRFWAGVDRLLSPLSQWLGFRMDLPIETVVETPDLETVHVEPVNLLGLWRLVELRRRD